MKKIIITPLQKALDEKGIRLGFIMKNTQLSYMKLYALRRGEIEPSLSEAKLLEEALGVSIDVLFPPKKKK